MRDPVEDGQGTLRQDISTALVGLYKEHFGKGPTRCQTYLEPNLVIVVLGEGYTASERTLFEAGKWHEVRSARQIWQDSMEALFVSAIEELTGRKVSAFLSANRQDPDLAVELFVLDPSPTSPGPFEPVFLARSGILDPGHPHLSRSVGSFSPRVRGSQASERRRLRGGGDGGRGREQALRCFSIRSIPSCLVHGARDQ